MSCPNVVRCLLAAILSLGCCLSAQAASMAVADASGGYAGKVLQKVSAVWAVPTSLKGEYLVGIRVGLDDKGRVLECGPVRKSGHSELDASACAAVRKAAPFGTPPYAMPIEIHLNFWTGQPKGAGVPAIQPTATQPAVLASPRASTAEELARQRAEAIARESTQTAPASTDNGLSPEEMQLNTGTSASVSTDGQDERVRKYLSRVSWALRQAIVIPAEIRPGIYYATVRLELAADGSIKEQSIIQSSGEAQLDKNVLRAIRRAGKVEAPPTGVPPQVNITFTLTR